MLYTQIKKNKIINSNKKNKTNEHFLYEDHKFRVNYLIVEHIKKTYQNIPFYINNILSNFQILCLFFPTLNKKIY